MVDPPFHRFVVFLELEDGIVRPKIVQCNNCGILHRVTELCHSEPINGKEHSTTLLTVDDIRPCLRENVISVLEANDADLPTWEMVKFIVDHQKWGDHVVLSVESDSGITTGKIVRILGENLVRVETFTRDEVF